MDLFQSKSILARLLAQENVTVNHAAVSTAMFDLNKRTLTLPVWKNMTGDIYDLLCGHEVGHALETPPEGWHNAIVDKDTQKVDVALKGYLNILEDARIEKKIKRRYPGLRASFLRGYKEFFERDMFGLKKNNIKIEDCILIDRINLHFKLGAMAAVPFNDDERAIVARVENLETWEEVEALARELLVRQQQENEEQQRQLQPGDDAQSGAPTGRTRAEMQDFEEGEEESDQEAQKTKPVQSPESVTDREFRQRERELIDTKAGNYQYLNLPKFDSRKFVVPFKKVIKQMEFTADARSLSLGLRKEFKAKNDRFIGQLIKEFEMRRNAQQQARVKVSKSGEIDVKKVFSYQINEDLFRRFTVMPQGKNHGLLMFFDMSGSMTEVMPSVIEQLLVLVEFCRRTNIKFEVYGFSNNQPDQNYARQLEQRSPAAAGQVHVYDANFTLRQYFTDAMTPREYSTMMDNLLLVRGYYENRSRRYYDQLESPLSKIGLPDSEELGGTPLNPSILVAQDIHERFVARTRAEVVNMAWLTDGVSDNPVCVSEPNTYLHGKMQQRYMNNPDRYPVVLRHEKLKYEVKVKKTDRNGTFALIEMLRLTTGSNVVCFDLVQGAGKRYFTDLLYTYRDMLVASNVRHVEDLCQQFRRNKIAIIKDHGYSEYYVIPGSKKDLEVAEDELAVESEDKKAIMTAFMDLQDKKRASRILLNRFIEMIA